MATWWNRDVVRLRLRDHRPATFARYTDDEVESMLLGDAARGIAPLPKTGFVGAGQEYGTLSEALAFAMPGDTFFVFPAHREAV